MGIEARVPDTQSPDLTSRWHSVSLGKAWVMVSSSSLGTGHPVLDISQSKEVFF